MVSERSSLSTENKEKKKIMEETTVSVEKGRYAGREEAGKSGKIELGYSS